LQIFPMMPLNALRWLHLVPHQSCCKSQLQLSVQNRDSVRRPKAE
jgi:hypothetical protein